MATHSDQLEQSFSPENIKQLMKMLAAHFGSSSEFSLHDLRNGIDNTIVAIENNHLTGRNIGDCGSNLGLEVLRCEGKSQVKDSYGYRVFFKNGTVFPVEINPELLSGSVWAAAATETSLEPGDSCKLVLVENARE